MKYDFNNIEELLNNMVSEKNKINSFISSINSINKNIKTYYTGTTANALYVKYEEIKKELLTYQASIEEVLKETIKHIDNVKNTEEYLKNSIEIGKNKSYNGMPSDVEERLNSQKNRGTGSSYDKARISALTKAAQEQQKAYGASQIALHSKNSSTSSKTTNPNVGKNGMPSNVPSSAVSSISTVQKSNSARNASTYKTTNPNLGKNGMPSNVPSSAVSSSTKQKDDKERENIISKYKKYYDMKGINNSSLKNMTNQQLVDTGESIKKASDEAIKAKNDEIAKKSAVSSNGTVQKSNSARNASTYKTTNQNLGKNGMPSNVPSSAVSSNGTVQRSNSASSASTYKTTNPNLGKNGMPSNVPTSAVSSSTTPSKSNAGKNGMPSNIPVK